MYEEQLLDDYSKIKSAILLLETNQKKKLIKNLFTHIKNFYLNKDQIWNINLFIRDLDSQLRSEINLYLKILAKEKKGNIRMLVTSKAFILSMQGSQRKLQRFEFTNEELKSLSFPINRIEHQEINDWQMIFRGENESEYFQYQLMFEEDRASIILINGNSKKFETDTQAIEEEIKAIFIQKLESCSHLRLKYIVGEYPIVIR